MYSDNRMNKNFPGFDLNREPMETDEVNSYNENGSIYDCNVCLDTAKDPVVTCCGHLFCWPCFYQVDNVDSNSKECPVCKGHVSESTLTPIYGNERGHRVYETDSGVKVPPRPNARRVESARQQTVNDFPAAMARILHRIHELRRQRQVHIAERMASSSRVRVLRIPGELSEMAALRFSVNVALSGAGREVENLETVVRSSRISYAQVSAINANGDAFTRLFIVVDQSQDPPSTNAASNAALPINPPSMNAASNAALPVNPPSQSAESSRQRRGVMPRASDDVESEDTRDSRRRRSS